MRKAGVGEAGNKYLRENYGIRIYRDGFRVLPYGDRDDDWLGLDARRVQNPTQRIGRNRILGWVEISRQENPDLNDKTNREGLIEEGKAFADLRDLCISALSLLEDYRYPLRPEARKPRETGSNVSLVLYDLQKQLSGEPLKLARALQKDYESEVDEWHEQVDTLTDLAGIGVTLEKVTHEFDKAINIAKKNQDALLLHLEKPEISKPYVIKIAKSTSDAINVAERQLQLISPLYFPERGKKELLSLQEIADSTQFVFADRMRELNVHYEVKLAGKEGLTLKANRGDLLEVFVNLLDNSLYWLEASSTSDPKIVVKIDAQQRRIIFADNGPGVSPKAILNLFKPFFTTKPRGRGLGLFICKDVLTELDANIEYLEKNQILPGANFLISFEA